MFFLSSLFFILDLLSCLCFTSERPELFDSFDLPENVRAKLIEKIKHRLTPQAEKVEAGTSLSERGRAKD